MSPLEIVRFDDFSGGLDLQSAIGEVKPPFTPFAENFRIGSQGELIGAPRDETTDGTTTRTIDLGAGTASVGYYAGVLDCFPAVKNDGTLLGLIVARQGSWRNIVLGAALSIDGATNNAVRTGMSTGSAVIPSFVMHNDKLYGLDPLNNIGVWDGTTLTTAAPGVDTGPPKGIILGIFNSRMFVAEADGVGALGLTVRWSEPFDATNGFINATGLWPTGNTVTLGGSAQAGEKIVAGVPTPDGLAVFTTGGLYLIYDEAEGFNTLVDPLGGTTARRSICVDRDGTIWGTNHRGIFKTNGRLPVEYVSDRVKPLFQSGLMAEAATVARAAGVIYDGSYFVSFTSWRNSGNTERRWGLEVRLDTGSIMYHSSGVANAVAYLPVPVHNLASGAQAGPLLLAARAASDGSIGSDGARYLVNTLVGSGNGGQWNPVTSVAGSASPPFEPDGSYPKFHYALPYIVKGQMIRLRDIRIMARAQFSATAGKNWQQLYEGVGAADGLPAAVSFAYEHAASWNETGAPRYDLSSGRARMNGIRGDAIAPLLQADYSEAGAYAAGPPAISSIEVALMTSSRRYT